AGTVRDRYGRLLGHLADGAGRWLNAELVGAGLARVVTRPDLRLGAGPLFEAEGRARAQRLGLWRDFAYRILPAEEARFGLNRFALVEGRVLAVAAVRGRSYLNFGEDWREDFTVSLDPAARRLFAHEGLDPAAYEGRRVRVRGWVIPVNGPMIEVSHPEQIELIE
ncbi:MAG: thermonuclease family protein, partial [Tistlia sp.]